MTREEALPVIRERLLRAWTYKAGKDVAEEIAQETLLLLESKYRQVTGVTDLVRLSFAISTHVSQTLRRRMRVGTYVSPPDQWDPVDPARGQEHQLLLSSIRSHIAQMKGRCPELLRLHLEGY